MTIVTKKCYYSNISKAIYFYFYSSDFDEINEKQLETIVVGIHVMLENDPAIQNQISRLKQFKLDINNLKGD